MAVEVVIDYRVEVDGPIRAGGGIVSKVGHAVLHFVADVDDDLSVAAQKKMLRKIQTGGSENKPTRVGGG